MHKSSSILATILGMLFFTVLPAQAEIYKWVNKDGAVKYTDTPPPNGAKQLSTLKHKPATPATSTPAATPSPAGVGGQINPTTTVGTDAGASEQEMAKKKQEIEEIEKRNKAEKEAQAKQKALNCKAAKANYESYSQGGRVYRMNEKGEREYLDDKKLAEGAAKAKKDMQESCN